MGPLHKDMQSGLMTGYQSPMLAFVTLSLSASPLRNARINANVKDKV